MRLKKLITLSFLLIPISSFALPVFTFNVSDSGTLSTLLVGVDNIDSGGLAAAHIDLDYDTSQFSLLTLTAGDFFSKNPSSLWSDSLSSGIIAGDPLAYTTFDATTGPDSLGIDFLELLGVASFDAGNLFTIQFSRATATGFHFKYNDALLIDAAGTVFTQPTATSPNPVPEPPTSVLLAAGAICIALCLTRKNRRATL